MLIAIIATLTILFGGGSLEHYLLNVKKPVKAAVQNKATVNDVLALSKELGQQISARNKTLTILKKSFLDLHTNHDSNLPDFETIFDKVEIEREEGQKNILDARFAMKELMTEEEWTEVFTKKNN